MRAPRNEREAHTTLTERQPVPTWQQPGKGHVYARPTWAQGVAKSAAQFVATVRGAK